MIIASGEEEKNKVDRDMKNKERPNHEGKWDHKDRNIGLLNYIKNI